MTLTGAAVGAAQALPPLALLTVPREQTRAAALPTMQAPVQVDVHSPHRPTPPPSWCAPSRNRAKHLQRPKVDKPPVSQPRTKHAMDN